MRAKCPQCGAYLVQPVEIPESLSTPDFIQAWDIWLDHLRCKRKPPTTHAQDLQLRKLAAMGPEQAIKAIEYCIEKNWLSIFYEPNQPPQDHGRPHGQRNPGPSATRNSFIAGHAPGTTAAERYSAARTPKLPQSPPVE